MKLARAMTLGLMLPAETALGMQFRTVGGQELCQHSARLLLDEATVSINNLGGVGDPAASSLKPQDIRFDNAFSIEGKSVDMVLSADSMYWGDPAKNAPVGDFAVVDVNTGSTLDLKVSFVRRETGVAEEMPPFLFTIAGLGRYDDFEGGAKNVTISGFEAYTLSGDSTHVHAVAEEDGRTTFSSEFVGSRNSVEDGPPHMALAMSTSNAQNSVSFLFRAVSSISMKLSVAEGEGTRQFFFAGASNVVCNPQAFCATMECPEFYQRKEGAERQYCSGVTCTEQDDLATCCAPITPDNCHPSSAMTFDASSQAYSNLGGMGPDFAAPAGLRLVNVLKGAAQEVDLVITNFTKYEPSANRNTGMQDNFLLIDLMVSSSVGLYAHFYKSGTDEQVQLPEPFTLEFFDLDMQANGKGVEEVTVIGASEYEVSVNSTVRVKKHSDNVTFTATVPGTAMDNPIDPANRSQDQLDKSASVTFAKGTSAFQLKLRVKGGEHGGRQIMMNGWSTLSCPAYGSFCTSLACPAGFSPKKNYEDLRCAGDVCELSDVGICCQQDEKGVCDSTTRLQLSADELMHNNLGGVGPGEIPKNIRIGNVFPGRKTRTEMRISVEGDYKTMADHPPHNVLDGGFLQVQVLAGTQVTLNVKLIDTATNEPAVKSFFLTLAGIDRGSAENDIESVTTFGFEYYNISSNGDVTAMETPLNSNATQMLFSPSAISPDRQDLPKSSLLSPQQIDKAVSLRFAHVSAVKLTLAVGHGNQGYRTFLIGGVSNLACPVQPAFCGSMVCPSTHKLKPGSDVVPCAGPTCTKSVDLTTCCEEVSYRSCADEVSLTFSSANLLVSNLGGLGPDTGSAPMLLYGNVFPYSGRFVDLVVRNITEYKPANASLTGVRGAFGMISMRGGTSAAFEFSLVDARTGMLLEDPGEFAFSVVDVSAELDYANASVVGHARMSIPQMLEHRRTANTHVQLEGTTFSATTFGADPWSFAHPRNLDLPRLHQTISLKFNTSFTLQASFAPGTSTSKRILFAGPTNLVCPARAYCNSYECPADLERIQEAQDTLCKGSVCTQADIPTCCRRPECAEERILVLHRLLQNNLGSKELDGDPDSHPRSIVYGDVFPGSGRKINLELALPPGATYYPHDISNNGLLGPFGRINLKSGSHVDLVFRFVDANTSDPVVVPSFLFTFSGIDMQYNAARERVTVSNYMWYQLSEQTALSTATSCDGSTSTFSANMPGGVEGGVNHPMAMTGALLNHSVTLLMPSSSHFTVTLRADAGWAGRNILFAGASSLVCGPKKACLTMVCKKGFTLRKDSSHKMCMDEDCRATKDHDTCCEEASSMSTAIGDVDDKTHLE